MLNKRQLHDEDKQRYKDVQDRWSSRPLDLAEIFRYPQLGKLIATPGARIHYSEIQANLFSLTLHDHVLMPVCPSCDVSMRVFKPLLESGLVVPVLLGSYSKFPTRILKELLQYPHISPGEHQILREASLPDDSRVMCRHCLEKQVTAALPSGNERLEQFSKGFCASLSPVLDSDCELIERFCFALKTKKVTEIKRLRNLAALVTELRSCHALNAIPSINRKEFEDLSRVIPSFGKKLQFIRAPESEGILANSLQLEQPASMSVEKYLEIILPFKAKLKTIVESILNEANNDQSRTPLSSLYSITSEINEQIRATQKSRRYQVLQATVGLAASNPALVRAVLIGGALGLCTSILGCGGPTIASAAGISAATSAGLRMLRKGKKVTDPRLADFQKTLARDIQNYLDPTLAKYLSMDVRALQIWDVRKALHGTPFS